MPTPTEPSDAVGPDPLIGETLANRYQIEVRLGEGAMGSVYRARHIKVGRPFAVKVLHPKLLADKKVAQRFDREAELAGRLRHPNVIGVVDVGETSDAMRYMVMDFAEGMDLAGLLSEAPMPAPRIMNLTRQILEGLFHAHEAGLIHRDFKPENVIVERDAHGHEVPRIVDFGIAILREGGDNATGQGRLTTNGLVLGTPHYMAPEQAVADPIDHRIDLFALGIVVYEMLCGKLPFDGTGAEVARANLLLDPPPISQRVPYLEVDPLLEAFARRLMAKRREARPPTARAAREILDLIERDRAAAAAALGVPLDTPGARKPQVTVDALPQVVESSPAPMAVASTPQAAQAAVAAAVMTAPPSTAIGVPAGPTGASGSPPQGPSMQTPMAIADAPRAPSRQLKTAVTEPLRYGEGEAPPQKSKRGLVIGAFAAVLGAVVAFLIIHNMGGKKDDDPKQIAAAVVIDAAPVQTITPPPPPAVDAAVADVAPAPDAADAIVDVGPGSAGSAETPKNPKHPIQTNHPTNTNHPKNPVGPGSGSATKAVVDTAGSGSATTPPPTDAVTTSSLVALYTSVGRDMETLRSKKGDDSITDIQPRYRLINLNDAMSTSSKRESAYASLQKLQRDIHAKLK